ncbi:MAG TPA: cellulose biosynthesis protein BcsS [Methylocystis sp.]|nr:cellulose biosynthesis protein BcsS [Methylocystis sp.]
MFGSPVIASVVSLPLVFGVATARACPTAQAPAAIGATSLCDVRLASAGPFENTRALSESSAAPRDPLGEGSAARTIDRKPRMSSLRYVDVERARSMAALPAWESYVTAPQALKFDFAEPAPWTPLSWSQEAEELARQESIRPLTPGNGAAAPTLWPAPLAAVGTYDALRRLDADKWRQLGSWNVKRGWEVEYAPTSETMFYARDFHSQTTLKTLAEAKLGISVLDASFWDAALRGKIYVGPFAVADSLRGGQESKIGAHVTLSEIGAFHVTFAGGVAHEAARGRGAFGLIETSWRF